MWTKDRISSLLLSNDLAVEKALVAIYDRQTRDEKMSEDTLHHNGVGFSGAHAKRGTYFARWVLSGRHLTGHHLARARSIVLHYTKQLAHIANVKAAKKEAKFDASKADIDPVTGRDMDDDSDHEPRPGSYAYTARFMAQSGIMSGDEADEWKESMKERFDEPPPPFGEP